MPATWTVDIRVTDLAERRIAVTGTRTDGEQVEAYHCETQVDLAHPAAAKQAIGAALMALHDEAVAKTVAEAVVVEWETDIADGLNALET